MLNIMKVIRIVVFKRLIIKNLQNPPGNIKLNIKGLKFAALTLLVLILTFPFLKRQITKPDSEPV
jgi:hypothetical protein